MIGKHHKDLKNGSVPENLVGILRNHEVAIHPLGVQVVEIRFDAEMLYRCLDAALAACGYGQAYHETLLSLKRRYGQEADDAVRAMRDKQHQRSGATLEHPAQP